MILWNKPPVYRHLSYLYSIEFNSISCIRITVATTTKCFIFRKAGKYGNSNNKESFEDHKFSWLHSLGLREGKIVRVPFALSSIDKERQTFFSPDFWLFTKMENRIVRIIFNAVKEICCPKICGPCRLANYDLIYLLPVFRDFFQLILSYSIVFTADKLN